MPENNFFWDPLSDNILQERDETGTVTAAYITEPGLYGNLISQNRSGVESQYHFDALGSTLALTDENQQVTDTNSYTAFGGVTEHAGGTVNPFQYIGQRGYYTDELTGQLLARRRSLSVVSGRWISPDVFIGITQLNLYRYGANCPNSFVDPSGEDFIALAHFHIRGLAIYHYSLEYWTCCSGGLEWESICVQYDIREARPAWMVDCHLSEWVELGGFDWITNVRVRNPGRPERRVDVPVAVVRYNRPDHGPISAIMPLYVGYLGDVDRTWRQIIRAARRYEWAEQQGDVTALKHWPKSLYWWQWTNSNTFVRQMVEAAGLPQCEMAGVHPGDPSPRQNQPREARPRRDDRLEGWLVEGDELIDDGDPRNTRPRP
jgi:RHS repeat-associated protein